MGESLCQSPGAERVELFRGVISMDWFVVFRWLEVLPDGEEIDLRCAKIMERLMYLWFGLAESDHEAGFGEEVWVQGFYGS